MQDPSSITFGSLFAGIGGFDLGLERAGMKCSWQVEIEPFAQEVLRYHFPNATLHSDIREVGKENLDAVDVICGGFPCQDISTAGRTGKGIARGEKSGLWREFARIIRELRPGFVLIENVDSIRRPWGGFEIILRDLSEARYDAEWAVLPASAFGAPHKRARLWLVAYTHEKSESNGAEYAEMGFLPQLDEIERSWSDPPGDIPMDDGLPVRMGLEAYGNALLPQIAEELGRRIVNVAR